jgi:predicted nuclease of predicted toxin-antitoxin system
VLEGENEQVETTSESAVSKRRFFVLDEDISPSLIPLFGRRAKVVSVRQFMVGAEDPDVIEEAYRREAVLVTNDAGLVRRYKQARRRKTEDACYPGLIHLLSAKELVQERMLRETLRKYVWNEVIEQDCLVAVSINEKGRVAVRHTGLCQHSGYHRGSLTRG